MAVPLISQLAVEIFSIMVRNLRKGDDCLDNCFPNDDRLPDDAFDAAVNELVAGGLVELVAPYWAMDKSLSDMGIWIRVRLTDDGKAASDWCGDGLQVMIGGPMPDG